SSPGSAPDFPGATAPLRSELVVELDTPGSGRVSKDVWCLAPPAGADETSDSSREQEKWQIRPRPEGRVVPGTSRGPKRRARPGHDRLGRRRCAARCVNTLCSGQRGHSRPPRLSADLPSLPAHDVLERPPALAHRLLETLPIRLRGRV